MKVLLLGSGGREHAIQWKLTTEGHEVVSSPGNPGIAEHSRIVTLDIDNHTEVSNFVRAEHIEFTVVGPEAPLAAGIADHFNRLGLPIFGPTKAAAEIETSKSYCCQLLHEAGVPIPLTHYYPDFASMKSAVTHSEGGIVLKKSGLAAGKGAEVVRTRAGLAESLTRLEKLNDGPYLVQNMEEGPELSYFALTDGEDFLFLGSAQDYKPLFAGGPNTGGMGGFSPHPILTPGLRIQIENQIVKPTIRELAKDGRPYRGILYFQLMITAKGPVVIEINCRFGDPETQLLMPLLDCELLRLLKLTTMSGFIKKVQAKFKPGVSVGIVMASENYPDTPKTGRIISGLDTKPGPPQADLFTHVFHAGTKRVDGQLITSGGRVVTVVGTHDNYKNAKSSAIQALSQIQFEGQYHRTDIANEVIQT